MAELFERRLTRNINISVIVPFNNEESNVEILYSRLKDTLLPINISYELIFIDDGSKDKTFDKLCEIYNKDNTVNIIRLNRNFGQAIALLAGFKFACGDIVITLDGDLQHDPRDIPRLLETMNQGYDIVNGWKREWTENFLTKKLPSLVAKRLIRLIFGINLQDISSTFKAYRRESIKDINLYGELHRFIPLLIRRNKVSICEIEIKCHKRQYGKTHYGLNRVIRVIIDIFILWFKRKNILLSKPYIPNYSIVEIKSHPCK